MSLPRRALVRLFALSICAAMLAFGAPPQKRKRTMSPASPIDERRLQAFLATSAKYNTAPVPTPLSRATAVAFVNTRANRAGPPQQMRKLARVAIFYHLSETSQAFVSVLTGKEDQQNDIARAALCLVALAWIGDPGQQTLAQQYFHGLQYRANVETDRAVLLEVVEA